MSLTVSLVVRALNEAEHIGTLLEAAARQSRPPDEVILVDSGSTDRTVEIATALGAHVVHIAPSDFSFGRALNLGCKQAAGGVLVFASAHVYPTDDAWLERLVAPFADDTVALAYGGQVGDERTQFSEFQVLRRWFPEQSDSDQTHPFCNNANCAIRRTVWEGLPYNEDLTGLEDLDWANRARSLGHRLVYVAPARVVHVHEESFRQTITRYRREAVAHKRIFGDQRLAASEALALFLANTIRDYITAVMERDILTNMASIPRFRLAQFVGSYLGFRESEQVTTELKRRFYYPGGWPSTRSARSNRGE